MVAAQLGVLVVLLVVVLVVVVWALWRAHCHEHIHPQRFGIATNAVMRSFQCYPRLPSSTSQPQDSWLDKLLRYGSLAMKLFAYVVGEESPLQAVFAVAGSTQTILIGAKTCSRVTLSRRLRAFHSVHLY